MMSEDVHPIQKSYWVLPGKLMAGEYPGAWDESAARARLRWLLWNGIDFFFDLTEEREGVDPYFRLLSPEAAAHNLPAAHARFAIPDYGAPTPTEMQHILDALDLALRAGQVVYLHCQGGRGRTGTVIGCYLVRHGFSGAEALEAIAAWRKEWPDGASPSPETPEQRALVLSWNAGS